MGEVTGRAEKEIRKMVVLTPVGHRLLSERQLCQELSCSRTTLRLILTKLVAEGRIRPVHGVGYFKTPSN